MSQAMQSRLLRVLQDGEIRPVGAPSSVRVDVRVIAASNQELKAMVAAGTFREDLYYRLRVLQVIVPPLRERREDIPMLVAHFAGKYATRCGKLVDSVDEGVMSTLMAYGWPGNIRELENAIERAVVLAAGSTLTPDVVTVDSMSVRTPGVPLVEHSSEC